MKIIKERIKNYFNLNIFVSFRILFPIGNERVKTRRLIRFDKYRLKYKV